MVLVKNKGQTMERLFILTLFLLVLILTLGPAAHSSVTVDFEGKQYEVTLMFGEFVDFETDIMNSPWWGNNDDAEDFAKLVDDAFGVENIIFSSLTVGPLFAYEIFDGIEVDASACFEFNPCSSDNYFGVDIIDDVFEEEYYYAKASVVPIPAAIWLFGSSLLGLVGYSRRKAKT